MKTILAATVGVLLFAAASHAQTTCQTYGNQTYCSDGTVVQQYGNQTFIQPPNRSQVICQTYGNQTFCN